MSATTVDDLRQVIDRLADMETERVKSEARTNSLLESMPGRIADALADRLGQLTHGTVNTENYARKSEVSVMVVIFISVMTLLAAATSWNIKTTNQMQTQFTSRLVFDGFYQTSTCKQLRAMALALGDKSINLPDCMTPADFPRLD